MITLGLLVVGLYMALWFIVGQLYRRNDVADVAWGLGFVVLVWALYINRPSVQLSLAAILVTIWGVRLSTHIFLRNRNKPEDFRYQQWRKEWGRWFLPRSLAQVYLLQGILLVCISAPLLAMGRNGLDSLKLINLLGMLVWLVGFMFEAIGDLQLKVFLSNAENKGKIMQSGLWKYSRHPNYFGEVLGWWGIWLISFGTPWFVWAIIGPVTITVLILKVSGIPLLEKKYATNKSYQDYARVTSAFIPLPPRIINKEK